MDPELLLRAAEEFGTPLYVYSEDQLRRNAREFKEALSACGRTKIFYAYKANSNIAICKILAEEGLGADVASLGELEVALRVGVEPERVIYTSNSRSSEELRRAKERGVFLNLDSEAEVRLLAELGAYDRVLIRLNPSLRPETHEKLATALRESKFGVHVEGGEATRVCLLAERLGLRVRGLHTHLGSQLKDTRIFVEALGIMKRLAVELEEKGLEVECVDLGGGLAIPYEPLERTPTPRELARALKPALEELREELGREVELWLEPGRWLVGNAGVLLCKVNSVKRTPYKCFANVDAGFETFLRPVLYGAKHGVEALSKLDEEKAETYDVAGHLCEAGDVLARGVELPKLEAGDILAFYDAGAYGFSMSSNYNLHPRPAEVLVRKGSLQLIRRRETLEDLLRNQLLPPDL